MPSNARSNVSDSSSMSLSLSLRLSCDRCRVQKLKCSVQDESGACQRCIRARVSCVFGRRSPSKRVSRQANRMPTIPPNVPMQRAAATPISPINSATLRTTSESAKAAATTASTSIYPIPTPNTQPDASIDSEPALLSAPEFESGSYDAQAAWHSPVLGLHSMGRSMSDCDSDMTCYDWMQSAYAQDDGNTFEIGQSDLAGLSQLATLTATASWQTESITAVETMTSGITSNNSVLAHQQLIILVTEIQLLLRKLEEGRWHTDSASSLDDYPVGSILELSEKFGAIAGANLSGAICVGGELGESGDEDKSNKKTSTAAADTPTILLVMCGYLWLVRIYSVVLSQFQQHLDRMPSSYHSGISTGVIISTAGTGSALRLGELPCADAPLGLLQIHTAVRMLLDVLRDIEGHLGCGAVVARDTAVALLLNLDRRQEGSASSLGKKATAVRELLREKMGL